MTLCDCINNAGYSISSRVHLLSYLPTLCWRHHKHTPSCSRSQVPEDPAVTGQVRVQRRLQALPGADDLVAGGGRRRLALQSPSQASSYPHVLMFLARVVDDPIARFITSSLRSLAQSGHSHSLSWTNRGPGGGSSVQET